MSLLEETLILGPAIGEAVNVVFEERLSRLVSILHRVAMPLAQERIDYELVGGLAVFVHVEEADPEHSKLSAFRLKDRVHVQIMDAAGLITPLVESRLITDLRTRLADVRASD